jgi:hypothetical protein
MTDLGSSDLPNVEKLRLLIPMLAISNSIRRFANSSLPPKARGLPVERPPWEV